MGDSCGQAESFALTFSYKVQHRVLLMFRFIRTVLRSSQRLPDAVFAELVDIIFTSLPPVTIIGVILTSVGILVAVKTNDAVIWALTALGLAVTAGRVALIIAYRRRASLEGVQDSAVWERRYAIGAYGFALVLGAFNWRAIVTGDPMVAMLVTSVMFGYGAGIVARLGVRPTVCVISLALAVVPTAIGYLSYAASAGDYDVKAMHAGQALLLIAFAIAGMEAAGHIYRTPPASTKELSRCGGARGYWPFIASTSTTSSLSMIILGIQRAMHCSSSLPTG